MSDEFIQLVKESAAQHSAHVIDTAIKNNHGRLAIEIFVDAEAGVTSDLCSAISKAVGEGIETRELVQSAYELVVSSPGIDRPLKFPWQYKKHIGRKLELKADSGDGHGTMAGKLLNVNDEGITLQVGKAGEPLQVPFASIRHAIVKSPW